MFKIILIILAAVLLVFALITVRDVLNTAEQVNTLTPNALAYSNR